VAQNSSASEDRWEEDSKIEELIILNEEISTIPGIQDQDVGARLFHQLEISGDVLRQLLLQELCSDREIRRGAVSTVLESDYAIVATNN
jgi:hypothetical protein